MVDIRVHKDEKLKLDYLMEKIDMNTDITIKNQ